MATSLELATEIASGEALLSELQNELQRATGLQKSTFLQQIAQLAMDLNGLVHEQHAQGWSSES